ncbi:MAG: ribosome-associated translation inhibitor RaiA [Pseudomonadota bacterium]
MQLSVKGKQLDIGAALRSHVEDSLDRILGKYFGDAIDARVILSREAHRYRAVVSAHVGRNIMVEAHGEAGEPYPAFDAAADRLSKRLRRHKSRLRDHHKDGAGPLETVPAQQYILAGPDGHGGDDEIEEDDLDGDAAAGANQPVVVAEMSAEIPSLTVSEAVMRMDLADLPAMMFRNSAHGGLNMIYRRGDGNIGWLDPRGNRGS